MTRVMLTVAYDGSAYHGWQFQPGAVSIESVLNEKLTQLLREPVKVIGASRTDAGVHALGNIAVFDTASRIPAEKFSYALNQKLPEDIRIRSSRRAPEDFHPRKVTSVKTYEYRILNEEFPNPLERLYAHFTYTPLSEERMEQAGRYLIGKHDFKSFCSLRTQAETTVREIRSLEVIRRGSEIVIRIRGYGFLYNMVRIIAGTLMEAGSGKYPPEHVKEILDACDRAAAGPTAPARGLTLISYEFPGLEHAAAQEGSNA